MLRAALALFLLALGTGLLFLRPRRGAVVRPGSFDLQKAEQEAMTRLWPEVQDHVALCEDAFNVLGACVAAAPKGRVADTPSSLKVCCALMTRLSNDVHCASLLAVRGYPAHVVSIVASAFESAHCIASIGSDDAAADRWIEHDDPTRPFLAVRELVRRALRAAGVPADQIDPLVETEYRTYRQLCLAKHAHPLVQTQLGVEVEEAVTIFNGPDSSEASVRAIWFGLEHAARLASFAARQFLRVNLADSHPDLVARVESIASRRKELESKAKTRWGTVDPLPGKW
jgi:hypothetical protein